MEDKPGVTVDIAAPRIKVEVCNEGLALVKTIVRTLAIAAVLIAMTCSFTFEVPL